MVRSVSEIVEAYLNYYPDTERKALRRLILLEHQGVNMRTLDRHLKKTFEAKMKQGATVFRRSPTILGQRFLGS